MGKQSTIRRLRRFFTPQPIQGPGTLLFLPASETEHLQKTLRLKPRDRCLLTDAEGSEAEAVIEAFERNQTRVYVEKVTKTAVLGGDPDDLPIHLYVSMPQRAKMNDLVEKAQELGVHRLIPLETERTAFKIPAPRQDSVLERWRKISQEAAKQSGASKLVHISSIQSWRQAWRLISPGEPALLCHPDKSALPLSAWCAAQKESSKTVGGRSPVHLWIGPEGGFSRQEVEGAQSQGAVLVHLGRKILKVDTAVIAAVSFLKLFLGVQEGGRKEEAS